MIDPIFWIAYMILGALAGLAGGIGLGGGIIIVPALLLFFTWQNFPADILMHIAVATSLCTIIFTAISATYAHHKNKNILWEQVLLLTPGIVVGAIFGALVADYLSSHTLQKIFGIFEIFVAYQMAFKQQVTTSNHKLPGTKGMILTGNGIGSLSTILGIGGGTLTIPFLTWCRIDIHKAIGVSSACSLPIAISGTLAMTFTGLDYNTLPQHNIGYIHWPAALTILSTSILFAPVGVRLTKNLPAKTLKNILAVCLAGIGFKMLF